MFMVWGKCFFFGAQWYTNYVYMLCMFILCLGVNFVVQTLKFNGRFTSLLSFPGLNLALGFASSER